MKKSAYVRFSITIFLLLSMLSPTAALAGGDGKKHYKQGLKHEYAEEWDKAVEEFALAVVDNPRDPEYRLHYQRALFNASQMFMKQGTAQAEQQDYAGAYISFRKAYGYDPVNELAKSEMERMVRLQKAVGNGGENPDSRVKPDGVKLVQTSYNGVNIPQDFVVPQQLEQLRDVSYPNETPLMWLIKEISKDLDLNVLFDSGSRLEARKVKFEVKNVTSAKALDYLFLQENLFFQKVGPRTILVADGQQRQKFQQLVLRTFYLANASPKDVANIVKTAIPAQPGRTPTIVLTDDATNSITIRDTTENIRLIGKLIGSLDKDRAEVVMDVAIYEVSNRDLLQFGNQIGNSDSLTSLGGTTRGVVGLGGNDIYGGSAATTAANIIPRAFGVGLVIPAVNLIALQEKDNTKLIASTQIHAFNNEDSSARIGQRVPVRTAAISNGFNNGSGGNNSGDSFVSNVFNYEQTGLTLKFKPLVFPNKDVQVAMEIESKDVFTPGETPTFTERTIKGTARVQNNKTLLLASVAQNSQSEGRSGLPILGLIPIIGRLFTAPTKNNNQTDIVIAVTPRVIRAPAILPEDLEERETGSLAVPTSSSLEAMVIQEEVEEQLASARRLGNNANVQLPDRPIDEPVYVKSTDAATTNAKIENQTEAITNNTLVKVSNEKVETPIEKIDTNPQPVQPKNTVEQNTQPTDSEVKTLEIKPTAENSNSVEIPQNADKPISKLALRETSLKSNLVDEIKSKPFSLDENPVAELKFLPGVREMKSGEKTKIAVIITSQKAFNSAVIGLSFDATKLAVKNVELGEVFGEENLRKKITPFINQNGKMFATLNAPVNTASSKSGVLAYITIEALADGKHELSFDRDSVNLTASTGENFAVKF